MPYTVGYGVKIVHVDLSVSMCVFPVGIIGCLILLYVFRPVLT